MNTNVSKYVKNMLKHVTNYVKLRSKYVQVETQYKTIHLETLGQVPLILRLYISFCPNS